MSIKQRVHSQLSQWFPGFFPPAVSPVDRLNFTFAAQATKFDESPNFGTFYRATYSRDKGTWTFQEITLAAFRQMAPAKRREILANASSAMSKMISDWVNSINQGWSYTADVLRPESPSPQSIVILEEFLAHMERHWDGLDSVISMMSDSLILHGSVFSELVFSDDGLTPRRLQVLPVSSVDWKESSGPDGDYWELGQKRAYRFGRNADFHSLHNVPTVQFVSLYPVETSPWGRAPLDPAMRKITNKEELYGNLHKHANSVAWPSVLFLIDIAEVIKKLGGSPTQEEIIAEIQRLREQLNRDFQKLGPASAMIYSSDVSVDTSISGLSRQNLGYISDMFQDLDRDIITGGKSASILHNRQEGIAERHAVVQLLGYDRFVRRGQLCLDKLFSYYFNLMLVAQGLPALAKFTFVPANREETREVAKTRQLQAEAQLRSAEAQQKTLDALRAAVAAGFMSQENAQMRYDKFLARQDAGLES